jgi:hypothetical protein
MREDAPHWGPYIKDRNLINGLEHYASTQSVDADPVGRVEYYFREGTLTTIVCKTRRIKVAPFDTNSVCEHHFEVPALHMMAEAFYTKSDLSRWAEVEAEVRKTVDSFVDN